MIFLSKTLPQLVYPLGLACILVVLALITYRNARFQRLVLLLALLFLWLGSTRWVAYGLARSLEWRILSPALIPQGDVIIVLGGGTETAQYPRVMAEVNGAGDRVLYAAKLYREKKAPNILLSGGDIAWLEGRGRTPAEDMAEILGLMGVPPQALILETKSINTYENSVECAKIVRERGFKRALLVTSAMHMPRAEGLFAHQGMQAIPVPVDYSITRAGWEHLFEPSWETQIINLLPSVSNLSLSTRALKEYLGIWVYHLRGLL
jgi:uncharacterized SAM-binding protein YcdF (DUF218 family)